MKIIEIKDSNFNKQELHSLLNNKMCFIGVFSKMCIHCQNMKSQWKELKNKLKKLKCDGLLLEIDAQQLSYIDYSSLTKTLQGFPSLMIFKKGKKMKEYSGNRSTEDMFKFAKLYLLKSNTNKKSIKLKRKNKIKTRKAKS